MSKIMFMEVRGGVEEFRILPWRRIVTVVDEDEFIAAMRLIAMREMKEAVENRSLPEDIQADLIKSLKIRLTDTGLTDYPETPEEQAKLYERMTCGELVNA